MSNDDGLLDVDIGAEEARVHEFARKWPPIVEDAMYDDVLACAIHDALERACEDLEVNWEDFKVDVNIKVLWN